MHKRCKPTFGIAEIGIFTNFSSRHLSDSHWLLLPKIRPKAQSPGKNEVDVKRKRKNRIREVYDFLINGQSKRMIRWCIPSEWRILLCLFASEATLSGNFYLYSKINGSNHKIRLLSPVLNVHHPSFSFLPSTSPSLSSFLSFPSLVSLPSDSDLQWRRRRGTGWYHIPFKTPVPPYGLVFNPPFQTAPSTLRSTEYSYLSIMHGFLRYWSRRSSLFCLFFCLCSLVLQISALVLSIHCYPWAMIWLRFVKSLGSLTEGGIFLHL